MLEMKPTVRFRYVYKRPFKCPIDHILYLRCSGYLLALLAEHSFLCNFCVVPFESVSQV